MIASYRSSDKGLMIGNFTIRRLGEQVDLRRALKDKQTTTRPKQMRIGREGDNKLGINKNKGRVER